MKRVLHWNCIKIVSIYKELKSIRETKNAIKFGSLYKVDILSKFYIPFYFIIWRSLNNMIVFRTMICEVTVVFSVHVLLYVMGIHGLGTYLFMDVSIYLGTCIVAQYDQWHVFWFKSERRLKVTREGLNYLKTLKLFSFICIEQKVK